MFSSLFSSKCTKLESGESLIPSLIASPAVQNIYLKKPLSLVGEKSPYLRPLWAGACIIERLECRKFDTLDSPGFCSLGQLPAMAWVMLMYCVKKSSSSLSWRNCSTRSALCLLYHVIVRDDHSGIFLSIKTYFCPYSLLLLQTLV